MLMKTHLAVAAFLLLLFLPHFNYKFLFLLVLLVATIIPDIDTAFSTVGKNRFFRIIQWLTKHRGIFHSFTLCFVVSIFFIFVYPPVAFPLFLGYCLHLLMDSFTVEGIRPFWPLRQGLNGKITTGGKIEYLFFVIFVIFDVILLISWFV